MKRDIYVISRYNTIYEIWRPRGSIFIKGCEVTMYFKEYDPEYHLGQTTRIVPPEDYYWLNNKLR